MCDYGLRATLYAPSPRDVTSTAPEITSTGPGQQRTRRASARLWTLTDMPVARATVIHA
jgi:hypothetical protein